MLALLQRNLNFIAWRNFADFHVYGLWLRAFIGVAVIAYVAWQAGCLVYRARAYGSASEELALNTTVGFAALVVPLFVLAIVDAYRPLPIAILGAVAVAANVGRAGASALIAPLRGWRRAIREHPALWILFLITSLPALLPPIRVDETSYHLAQVQQWLQHGGLSVDPYIVYPLYTNNWHLLMGVGMLIGGVSTVHLLTWCAGVLTALLVLVLVERAAVPNPLRNIAVVALFITPLFQRYLTVGLVDVPLMLYLTASVALVLDLGNVNRPVSWQSLLPAALCVGMFTGMKILNFAFAPLFIGLALIGLPRRDVARLALLSACIGSLWYARNIFLSGDPAPPLLHHALGIADPYWTSEDVERLSADIKRGLSWRPLALLALPIRVVSSTADGPLRDWPALGYILILPLSLLFVQRLWQRNTMGVIVATWYSVAIWIATAYLIRYAYFLPLAAASGAIILHVVLQRFGVATRSWLAGAVGIVLLIGPTASAIRYIKAPFAARIPTTDIDRWRFEQAWTPSARLLDLVASVVPVGDTIYSLGVSHLKYYFERRGYPQIGYEFHRGRYPDLARAIGAGRTSEFFEALPARYVVVDTAYASKSLAISGAALLNELDSARALEQVASNTLGTVYRVRRFGSGPTP